MKFKGFTPAARDKKKVSRESFVAKYVLLVMYRVIDSFSFLMTENNAVIGNFKK